VVLGEPCVGLGPCDEVLDAFLEVDFGFEAEEFFCFFGVGIGVSYVAFTELV